MSPLNISRHYEPPNGRWTETGKTLDAGGTTNGCWRNNKQMLEEQRTDEGGATNGCWRNSERMLEEQRTDAGGTANGCWRSNERMLEEQRTDAGGIANGCWRSNERMLEEQWTDAGGATNGHWRDTERTLKNRHQIENRQVIRYRTGIWLVQNGHKNLWNKLRPFKTDIKFEKKLRKKQSE
jgi:hypothetical protein